ARLISLSQYAPLTKRHIRDSYVLYICIAAPVISYLINTYSQELFGGLTLGFLILAVNGLLTFIGLWFISKPGDVREALNGPTSLS
ncbi:MAG: hypothetical protein ABJB16_16990, partial [Saprospiraceae bacterium]